jgi:glucuronoarabinoxylan endo-1,4-beta-xylanase
VKSGLSRLSLLLVTPCFWLIPLGALTACGGGGGAAGVDAGPPPPVPVTIDVEVATKYQVMVGFGAAAAYFANYPSIHPSSAAIYQTIFNDLGLQVLRIGNWFQNNNDNGASLNATVTLVKGAQAALGYTPVLLMSSWNPEISLKSNGVNDAGGTLIKTASGGYDYADFGQWWSQSLAAYAAAGVMPDYISIQNEPNFSTTNEGTCLFDPTEDATNAGYGAALDAVKTAIAAASPPLTKVPKMVGPEVDGLANNRLTSYVNGITATGQLGELDAIAHHLYNGGTAALPNSFDAALSSAAQVAGSLPTWMTEYAPNNPDMFDTAALIQNSVTVEGVSTYLYWDLFWPAAPVGSPPEGLVSIESPSDPSTWRSPNGFFINDSYYAIQHFAKWIGVGWQRVGATASVGSVGVSAFLSPDGTQLTVVLVNTDGVDHPITITAGGADGGPPAFGTTAVYRTSGTAERANPLGPLPAEGGFDFPAQAIATVTFGP